MSEPNIPLLFRGEEMCCVVCGRVQQSDPAVNSQWRAVQLNDHVFYACPEEFPPDGSGAEDYKTAYLKVLKACGERLRKMKIVQGALNQFFAE